MRPIPTTYSGIRFRSRLEAEVAQLLHALRIEWRYDTESILLPNGQHYRPDFYLPQLDIWLEARGYNSPSGCAQVDGLTYEVRRGAVPAAFVLLNTRSCWWTCGEADGCEAVALRCARCGAWGLAAESTLQCRTCRSYDNREHVFDVRIVDGRVRLADPLGGLMTPHDFARAERLLQPRPKDFVLAGAFTPEVVDAARCPDSDIRTWDGDYSGLRGLRSQKTRRLNVPQRAR